MSLVDTSNIRRELAEIYDSEFFPFYCILGGALIYAFTQDILWVLIGIGLFVLFLFKRR